MKEYSNKKFSRRKFLFLLGFAGLGTLTYSIGNLSSFFVNLSNQIFWPTRTFVKPDISRLISRPKI